MLSAAENNLIYSGRVTRVAATARLRHKTARSCVRVTRSGAAGSVPDSGDLSTLEQSPRHRARARFGLFFYSGKRAAGTGSAHPRWNDPWTPPRGRAPGTTPTRPSGASATSSPPTRSRRARENRRTGADALANARTRIAHAVRGPTRTKNDGFPRRASSVSCASSTCAPGLIGVVHLKPYQECF